MQKKPKTEPSQGNDSSSEDNELKNWDSEAESGNDEDINPCMPFLYILLDCGLNSTILYSTIVEGLDTSNIISSGRRTRGVKVDYKAAAAKMGTLAGMGEESDVSE